MPAVITYKNLFCNGTNGAIELLLHRCLFIAARTNGKDCPIVLFFDRESSSFFSGKYIDLTAFCCDDLQKTISIIRQASEELQTEKNFTNIGLAWLLHELDPFIAKLEKTFNL